MPKKRVLVAHPRVIDSGGNNSVAAWTLQALREQFDVTLATLQPVDCAALNRSWGTSLRSGDFRVHLAPLRYQHLARGFPGPGALLDLVLTIRLAQDLARQHRYDVLVGTNNEIDFGRRGIQYIHHPWIYLPRPDNEIHWYHHIPGALAAYRAVCRRISRATDEGLCRNVSIANSSFIAGRVRVAHGVDSLVVYPPVTTGFPDIAWERRERAIVAVGRIHGCKRWEMAVDIVDEVRRRGHELALTLIGHTDDDAYRARLERMADTRPWLRLRFNVTREELKLAVASHRYGIHTMQEEHFGMAPAEILAGGCVLFAHNSGGPIEILGGDDRLLFDAADDAARKIEQVLSTATLEADLRRALDARRHQFSTETFCGAMRQIVDRFEP